MNRTDPRLLEAIAPVTDDEVARLASPGALADLAAQITASCPADPDGLAAPGLAGQNALGGSDAVTGGNPGTGGNTGTRRRKRVLLAVPAAAAVAAVIAGVLLATSGSPARHMAAGPAAWAGSGDGPLPPAASKALSFTVAHRFIDVVVKNPYADPSWYRADFVAHHLDITLGMIPVSPSLVGTVPYTDASSSAVESEVTMLYAPCASAPSGGRRCAVGIRVPLDFRGRYDVDFGRAARPGEKYVSTNSAFAPGEALHGMGRIVGQPVPAVLGEIARRHLSAILNDHETSGPPAAFPGTWYVTGASPYAPGEVMLFVSRTPGGSSPAQPAERAPRPAPASSGH